MNTSRPFSAFSLIELLVVMGIMAILLGLAVPAFTSIGRAAALTNSGYLVEDQLKLARQIAVGQNQRVAVRIYKMPGETGNDRQFRALRLYLYDEEGKPNIPHGNLLKLPEGIIFSPDRNYSTVLSSLNQDTGQEDVPGSSESEFKTIEFGPTGGTNLSRMPNTDKWFVTLLPEKMSPPPAGLPAKNFITVMIDPVTGRLKTFQP